MYLSEKYFFDANFKQKNIWDTGVEQNLIKSWLKSMSRGCDRVLTNWKYYLKILSSQETFICSRSRIEILEKGMKYVQS